MFKFFNSFFKKKKSLPTLEFISLVPGLEENYPVIPLHQVKIDWRKEEIANWAKVKEQAKTNTISNIVRCPGINDLLTTGWVLTSWTDIEIDFKDKKDFSWRSPLNPKETCHGRYLSPLVEFFSPEQSKHIVDNSPAESADLVVKFTSPWMIVIPEGYNLYMTHVPYIKETRFTTLPGMLRSNTITKLHIQVLWHKQGKTLIKAGTPLAHIMLVPNENSSIIQRPAAEKDLILFESAHFTSGSTWNKNYKKINCIFAQLLKKKDTNE